MSMHRAAPSINAKFYGDWGFRDNPFSSMPLGGNESGSKLLVGREQEVAEVMFGLKFGGEAFCLDGPVGVGKTSLANVAAYRCEMDHYKNPITCPLLLPCRQPFEIGKDELPAQLKFRVLLEVAQTLIEKSESLRKQSLPQESSINAWLNHATFGQIEGQVAGFGAGKSSQPSDAQGFIENGFVRLITKWLENSFPDRNTGGVVCVIDNLELLETSRLARRTIEDLRDSLFSMHGIRWVICGAHGIIHSVVASPRLNGYVGEPLPIKRLKLQNARSIFETRQSLMRDATKANCYLPISAEDFHKLYMILGQNLRQSLAYAHSYCKSIAQSNQTPETDEAKKERFNTWLKSNASAVRSSIESHAGQTAINLLRNSIKTFAGEFTPGDFSTLGFKSNQALSPHVKSLEECGLVEATRDESDQRRRTITVTGKGWLLDWAYTTL